MAIYDLIDPTDPQLLDFCTRAEDKERFKSVDAWMGHVACTIWLNPSYEAHFSMTPDHARAVAVRLIDAAEAAEFQVEQKAEQELRRTNAEADKRELRRLKRKVK